MKKTIQIASLLSLTVFCSGCATPYAIDRGRDAADIFTATFGSGYGAKVLVGPTLPASWAKENYKEIYRVTADPQYIIGLVGLVPSIFVVKDDLRNVPVFAAQDWPLRGPSTAYPEQFFWRTLP